VSSKDIGAARDLSGAAAAPPTSTRWSGKVGVAIATLAALLVFILVATGGSGKGAVFHGRFGSSAFRATSASEIQADVVVRNDGTKSGSPTCIVVLSSPGETVIGRDTVTLHRPIQPHRQVKFAVRVPVTSLGASQVVEGASGVNCY
jgi:hypothetical protein